MFAAFIRAAAGFVFGALVGSVVSLFIRYALPIVKAGAGENHELVGYMQAFAEFWILVVFIGALMGVLVSAVVERPGGAI